MSRAELRLDGDVTVVVDDETLLGEIEQHGGGREPVGIGRVAAHDETSAFGLEQEQQQVFGDQHGRASLAATRRDP
jgi:hypothetical protein